jgi:hypothetical protein
VIVGFGDWSNNGLGISRRCSSPISEIRWLLSRRPNVLFKNVDEFRSSCICHGCRSRLTNMKAASVVVRPGIRKEVQSNKVHKVLHCRNSEGGSNKACGKTWNRDANAANNILMLLKLWISGEERPAPFRRGNNVTIEALPFTTSVADPLRSASGSDGGVILWASLAGEIQA